MKAVSDKLISAAIAWRTPSSRLPDPPSMRATAAGLPLKGAEEKASTWGGRQSGGLVSVAAVCLPGRIARLHRRRAGPPLGSDALAAITWYKGTSLGILLPLGWVLRMGPAAAVEIVVQTSPVGRRCKLLRAFKSCQVKPRSIARMHQPGTACRNLPRHCHHFRDTLPRSLPNCLFVGLDRAIAIARMCQSL